MANMLDYLDWRGDLSMTKDPFNEVDKTKQWVTQMWITKRKTW